MKKEKYIKVKKYKGNTYFTVQFHYEYAGQIMSYSKTFNRADYTTDGECLKDACKHRDIMRVKLLKNELWSNQNKRMDDLIKDLDTIYPLAYGTIQRYKYIYNNYIKKPCGKMFITDIKAYDIQKTLNNSVKQLNNAMIRSIYTLWKKLYHVAKMEGIMVNDITDIVIIPKSKKVKKVHESRMTDNELEQIISELLFEAKTERATFNTNIIAHALRIMRYTGMRPAECFGLTRENISESYISVTHSIGRDKNNERVERKAKTDRSIRKIPITSLCRIELDAVMEMSMNHYVFSNYDGKLMDTSKVGHYLSIASTQLGIDFRMYDLRHQFATDLLTNGCDTRTLMELMGHSSTNMTLCYPRSDDDLKIKAVNLVEKK